jgi:hypothetical protein
LIPVFADFCGFGPTASGRFFAVLGDSCGGALGLHHFLVAAVGAPCSAALPDLLGKVLPLFLGRFVDDLPAGVVRPSGVLKDSLGVLRQRVSSGIVLPRPLASAFAGYGEAKARIATLAQPAEIFGGAVGLIAINVINHHIPRAFAQRTPGGSGRAALGLMGAIPLRPIADLVNRLAC